MNGPCERPLLIECQGLRLTAILHATTGTEARNPGVVIAVGGPQYRVGSHRQFVTLARALAQCGYPVLRFDFRGMGDSEGEFPGFEKVDADMRAAVDCMLDECPALGGIVIFGLCDGASAALLYAPSDRRVSGLALANPWVRTAQGAARSLVRRYYGRRLLQWSFWRKTLVGQTNLKAAAGDFLRKLGNASSAAEGIEAGGETFIGRMLHGLRAFGGPTLLLLSEKDLTAGEFRDLCGSNASWSRAVAAAGVRIEDCPGADHTFSDADSQRHMIALMLAWLQDARQPWNARMPGAVPGSGNT